MTTPPPRREITQLEALKLLAHPMRQRVMQQLRRGPATSTTIARALGESSGLASYHLRQMAQYGFIEEVPELAHGRERWWRSARVDLRFPPRSQQSPEMRSAMDELTRLDLAADLQQLARFQLERDNMGEWGDALLFSRGSIRVTVDELKAFFEDYIKLLNRYRHSDEDTPPGARVVLARWLAFPAVDRPEDDDTPSPEGGTGHKPD